MAPTFHNGDRVLIARRRGDQIPVGDIVVLSRPSGSFCLSDEAEPRLDTTSWVIKRVAAVSGDPIPEEVRAAVSLGTTTVPQGMIVVLGDNPSGNDSRQWGLLSADRVLGVVARRIHS